MPSGGIGSTINIRTTKTLDSPGLSWTLAGSGVHDESTEEGSDWTPEISGLFSNTFADDTIGVALSLIRQERNNGVDTASVDGWRSFTGEVDNSDWGGIPPQGDPNQVNRPGAGDIYSVPQAIGYQFSEYEQTRTNGQLTLQWRPSERIEATLDYTFADFELERNFNNLSAWFNFGGQETVWTDGPIVSPLTYRENSMNSDFSMGGGTDASRNELSSTGLNIIWDATDYLVLEFDHHNSTSESNPDSPWGDSALLSTASFTRDVTTGYFEQGGLPILELGLNSPLSPEDMIVTGSVFTNNIADMDIEQSRLAGNYNFDTGFIEAIDFGIQLTEVDYRSAGSRVQRDAWGGVTQPGAIADLLTPASSAGAFDQVSGGSDPRLQTNFYTWDLAQVVARTEQLMASGEADTFMLADMGYCGTGLCPSNVFQFDRRTTEETEAIYVQVNMAWEIGEMPFAVRAGLRYEQTDITSQALSPAYTRIDWIAGNELTAVRAPDSTFTTLEGDYDAVLPNLDLRLDFTDELVGRISLSKTLTRPNFLDIQGGQTVSSLVRVNGGTGSRGNPALDPFDSDNIDISLEYYYGEDSYFAAGYFHKDVENFIGTSSVVENTFDLPHPALGPLWTEAAAATGSNVSGTIYSWILENRPDADGVDAATGTITGVAGRDPSSPFNLTVPINIEQATMDGWEVVLQHNFGETGFGVILNATVVEADIGYDDFSLDQQFVLTGLSDSANFIAFYDRNGISVRAAYNWRDDFLAGIRQRNIGAGPPTYVDEYEQWDLSASYWFGQDENYQVYLDILNFTDETTYVYGRDENQPLFATQLGRRFNLGFRYKF